MKRSRTVFQGWSALSGRVRVVEDARERRLIVGGDILSVFPLDGDWARVHREYWWRALTEVRVPRRPSVLLVGLGGGTQVHLLRQIARPRALAVVERDAVIMHAAEDWFDLVRVGGLEYLCGEAADVVRSLAAVGRRFDLVIEDAAYADDPERAVPLALALAPLVTARGALVVNRHRRSDAAGLARRLRRRFREVRQVRVRREGENVLVCCARPRLRM